MGEIWSLFINLIFEILKAIHGFVGDWGLSIVVLTIIFRLLLWPLTVKQTRSMQNMQKIQPLMKEVQEKYADDREKQNEEMMKLYSEHKVNPLSGCLPMLLQMPLLFAFYSVLAAPVPETIEETGAIVVAKAGPLAQELGYAVGDPYVAVDRIRGSFLGIIPDIMLSPKAAMENGALYALPFLILLVVFGASIILPALITPQSDASPQAKQQKMMSYTMAVFLVFVGYSIPAGALLYYDVSSLFAVGQQYLTQRAMKKEEAEQEEIVVEAKSKKNKDKKTDTSNKGKRSGNKA